MAKRQLVLAFVVLVFAGCTSKSSEPGPSTRPGPPTFTPASAGDGGRISDRQRMHAPTRTVKLADPRVTACTTGHPGDRAALDSCLEALTHPQTIRTGTLAATLPPIVNPSWAIPQWYIKSTGADTNTCVDSSHPCKTVNQIVWNRWQTDAPRLRNLVQFNFLDGQSATTDRLSIRPVLEDGAIFAIVGTPNAACTTTLSSVTAKNRTTVPNWTANIAACASGAKYRKVVDTTHPAVFWVSSLSGSVATFNQPFVSNVPPPPTQPAGFSLAEADVLANGDTVTFYDLPTLYVDQLQEVHSGQFFPPQVFVENMRIGDPLTGTGTNSVCNFTTAVLFSESLADCQASFTGQINSPNILNSLFVSDANGSNLLLSNVIGGQMGSSTLSTGVNLSGAFVGGDSLLLGDILISSSPFQDTQMDSINLQTAIDNAGQIDLFCSSGVGFYGSPTIHMLPNSFLNYQACGAPTSAFISTTALTMQTVGGFQQAFASAYDTSHTPGPWLPALALSPSALAATIAAGGFNNVAYGDQGQIITGRDQASAAPATYVAPVTNGGTGTGSLCPSGQALVSNGSTYTCQTISTGASLPVCASTAFIQSTGSSYACTAPPLPVGVGGTGDTSFTSGLLLVGNGSSPVGSFSCPVVGDIVQRESLAMACVALSGDISFPAGGPATVTHIQGNPVSTGVPTDGQVYVYDGTSASFLHEKIPLASLAQSGATTNQIATWNGSSWIPANNSPTIPLSNITQSGATTFQFAEWNGSSWVPAFATPPHVDVSGACSPPGCTFASTTFTVPTGKRAVIRANAVLSTSTSSATAQFADISVTNGSTNPCVTPSPGVAVYNPAIRCSSSGGPCLSNDAVTLDCQGSDTTVGTNTYSLSCGVSVIGTGISCVGTMSIDLGQ